MSQGSGSQSVLKCDLADAGQKEGFAEQGRGQG